jgi:hypothetical protein
VNKELKPGAEEANKYNNFVFAQLWNYVFSTKSNHITVFDVSKLRKYL